MSLQRKMKYTIEDIASYLEEKISSYDSEVSDEEYNLYIAYQKFGEEAFFYNEFKNAILRLKADIRVLWEDE